MILDTQPRRNGEHLRVFPDGMPTKPALLDLRTWLDQRGYDFISPTPATHQRLIAKRAVAREGTCATYSAGACLLTARPELHRIMERGGISPAPIVACAQHMRVSECAPTLYLTPLFPPRRMISLSRPTATAFADFILAHLAKPVESIAESRRRGGWRLTARAWRRRRL